MLINYLDKLRPNKTQDSKRINLYLITLQGKVVIKINPKHSSQKCSNCGRIDQENRDGEKFICVECGDREHADIGAAKTIRDRGLKYSTRGLGETG